MTALDSSEKATEQKEHQMNNNENMVPPSSWSCPLSTGCTNNSDVAPMDYGHSLNVDDDNGGITPAFTPTPSASHLDHLVMHHPEDVSPDAPLILLLGWAGCRDRYLAKYASFYEKDGYVVVRYTAPISKIRSFSSYRKYALAIYENVIEQHPHRPIFIHMFSMNGCSVFAMLWDLLENVSNGQDIKDRVQGLIFDSSPANVMPWHIATAIAFASFPQSKYRQLTRDSYRAFLTGFLSLHRAAVWAYSNFDAKSYENNFAFFLLMRFNDLPKKQLYLYSDADNICLAESIRDFQKAQQSHQVDVQEQCWTDTDHCQHFRRYEPDYTAKCLQFIHDSKH